MTRIQKKNQDKRHFKFYLMSLLLLLQITGFSAFSQTTYPNAGSYTYAVPSNTPFLFVECWGAGGAGSKITSNGSVGTPIPGGGGGGGAYAAQLVPVTPGNYSLTVGAGGLGNSSGNGGDSYFSTTVRAKGGTGGANNSKFGGAGGDASASIGTYTFSGGKGADGLSSSYSGGGGGGAGSFANGQTATGRNGGTGAQANGGDGARGTGNTRGPGANGSTYGGGGSGGYATNNTDQNGGNGAQGYIVVTIARVEVNATLGTVLKYYSTLSDAILAINNGTHKGAITVKILTNLVETTALSLVASGSGGSSYTSINLYPTASNLSISGNFNSPFLTFNGADNVTIDGRENATGSTPSLTISNTNTGNNTSTLYFNNTAQRNTVKYCTILGGGTATGSGTIFFSATGPNSNNSIENCLITNNGARRPYAVYSNGGTDANNQFLNNEFYDTWLPNASSSSIYIGTSANSWTISGNSFYDTGLASLSGTRTYSAVTANGTTVNGLTISNNFIGGSAASCGGAALSLGTTTTASTTFQPIAMLASSTSVASTISGNTIKNIQLKSSNTTPFAAIFASTGLINVNSNVIGEATGVNSIIVTTTTDNSTSYGIQMVSTGNKVASENTVASITLTSSSSNFAHSFTGIYKGYGAYTVSITGNQVGSEITAQSIMISTTGTTNAQNLYGISNDAATTATISNNTVANLVNSTSNTNPATAGVTMGIYSTFGINTVTGNTIHDLTILNSNTSLNTPSVAGVLVRSTSVGQTVSNNTVYALQNNTASADPVGVAGIYYDGPNSGTNVLDHNLIYGLSSSSSGGLIGGLYLGNGVTQISNNLISITNSLSNSVYGIYDLGVNNSVVSNLYHNTVYLAGTTLSAVNSFALVSASANNTRNYKNNILYNTRKSAGKDYAIYYEGTWSTANLTADYNDYWAPSASGVVGWYNGDLDLDGLRSTVGKDANSVNLNPGFQLSTAIDPDEFKPQIQLAGSYYNVLDWGSNPRFSNTMGIWEFLPIEVWSNNVFRSKYGNLKSALSKISDGTWTGSVVVKILGSSVEPGSAILGASGTGGANYSNVLIYPEAANIVVSGNFNAPLILLDGADNVSINGSAFMNNFEPSLTLKNTHTGVNASTVTFAQSAQNNSIKYAILSGNAASATQGVITFSTSSLGTGNSADTISNCLISGNGTTAATRPYNAIYSLGTSGRENSGIVVANNQLFDFLNPGATSNGILIGAYSKSFTLTGNSFYETSSFTTTSAVEHSVVKIANPSGGGFNVTGNYIGGNASLANGVWMKSGNNNLFSAISISANNAQRSSVQGNVIRGFNYLNSANADWYGISLASGAVDIGSVSGNTIGETTGLESIYLTNTTTDGTFYGIYLGGADSVDCSNNVLSAVSVGATSNTLATSLYGIFKAAVAGNVSITYNTIGGLSTESNFIARSLSTGNIQNVVGIYSAGTGTTWINHNSISHVVNATTGTQISPTRGIWTVAGANRIDDNTVHDVSTLNAQSNNFDNAGLIGIHQMSADVGTTQYVRGNDVSNLTNLTSATIELYGIFFKGTAVAQNEVSRNFVHSFIIQSTDGAYFHGISMSAGKYTCSNNVVFIGANISTGCSMWGLWNGSADSVRFYHNTVYISGVAQTGTSNSFAFRDRGGAVAFKDIRNNIFWNARTSNPQIAHFSIYLDNTTNTIVNYNDYQFAQSFGRVNATDYATLASWKSGTGLDANSFTLDPTLTNLGGISPSDYQTGVSLSGTPMPAIAFDYGYSSRSVTQPTMGAWEFIANPVEVWVSGVYKQSYANLRLAFNAINGGVWTGDLTVKIKANITEAATAVLYQSGYAGSPGTSNYSRVNVIPARTDIQVRGNLAAPLIELNGADNVVFNGRLNGTGQPYHLTLINNNTSTSASTLRFINSAESDSVVFCTIQGLSMNPSGGIVHFSTSSTGNGNDNNVLKSNKITVVPTLPAVNSRVINAIYSAGTAARENSGIQLIDNEIYNVFNPTASSNAIQIAANSTAISMVGNSIYETTDFVPAGAYTYQGIRINNAAGVNYLISSNYIGGKALLCQGTALTMASTTMAYSFQPVYVNVGTGAATSVQGNVIKKITMTSPSVTPFAALTIVAGTVDVGTIAGNMIGGSTDVGSIMMNGVAAVSNSYGILVNSPSNVTISNNTIGSLLTNVTGSTTNAHNLYGIYKSAVAGVLTISNNTIGSSTIAGSLKAASISTANEQSVYGIYTLGTGNTTISDNQIVNLLNATTRPSPDANTVGVYYAGSNGATSILQRNFIYKLFNASNEWNSSNQIIGLYLNAGSLSVQNNIIWLGDGVLNRLALYGIYDVGASGQTKSFYHNTIYLSGSPTAGTVNTYAYYKSTNVGTTLLRNNIFFNDRTATWGGTHFAVGLIGTTGVTINNNDYECTGALVNSFNGATISGLASWKTSTGQDVASLNVTPFVDPTTADPTKFRPSLDLFGATVGVTQDYALTPRNATQPTMGAWERVNKWKGSLSIDFNNAANWTFNMVPSNYDNIIFDDAPQRPCTIAQDRFVGNIVNAQAPFRFVVNGFKLTIKGSLLFTNGAQIDATAAGSTLAFNGLTAQTIPSGALYNDRVSNLIVNNTNNVTLNGTLVLMNQITAPIGRLNASSIGTTLTYAGLTAQTISPNVFLNEKVYNLNVNNLLGVTLNTNFTVDNSLTIASGANLTLNEPIGLTVAGTLTNNAGATGLLLKSSSSGTASIVNATTGVPATVQRYIAGAPLAWHFLSTPVASQAIKSTPWTPSGTYGDGTGYDLYVWDETASCWVYNLNSTVSTTWNTVHPQANFVPGRGYLYALQENLPTKNFVGNLNAGPISIPVTSSSSAIDTLKGFNMLGNPYPSSIDWRNNAGYTRSNLVSDGGGYWIWVWSALNNNYGVFNSIDSDTYGTNNITAFISPMQGFFVEAASDGSLVFNNTARSHVEAGNWLRSSKMKNTPDTYYNVKNLRMAVSGVSGGDEVKIGFGYPVNEGGAQKLFSPVENAPSLYMNGGGKSYSTRRFTDTRENSYIPINFKAGESGAYTFTAHYEAYNFDTLYLQDLKTNRILELKDGDTYTFNALPSDAPTRFLLHFGAVVDVTQELQPQVWSSLGVLNVKLENMIGDYQMEVSDLEGRVVATKKLSGGEQWSSSLFGRGFYLVTLRGNGKVKTVKVLI